MNKILLSLFCILAILLRIYNISYADPYTDEVLYAFRSIGMIDYVASSQQPSTWEWFKEVPSWAHLSFHDHPILFFLIEHVSLKIFGVGLFAMRFPSVLFGSGTIIVIFFLVRHIFRSSNIAILVSAILSVQSFHVWISRTGMQDATAIFFIVCVLYAWVLALDAKKLKFWILWGIILGLAILTKYTVIITIPLMILYSLVYKKSFFLDKNFWIGFVLCILITSPIWIYNSYLFKTVGHFDFQISAALHQDTPEWPVRLGRKQIGSLSHRFTEFLPTLHKSQSPLFTIIFFASFILSLVLYFKKKDKNLFFLIGSIILIWMWFLVVGSAFRFVVMIVPFEVLLISYISIRVMDRTRRKKYVIFFLSFFVFVEALYTINTFFIQEHHGWLNVTYSQLYQTSENFGFNQLNIYLENILQGKISALYGQPDYGFLSDIHKKYIKKKSEMGADIYPLLIIFNQDIRFLGKLWVIQRHLIYEGWPVLPNDLFKKITGNNSEEMYREQGIKNFIYITNGSNDVLKEPIDRVNSVDEMKDILNTRGIVPRIIYNSAGQEAFFVYEF